MGINADALEAKGDSYELDLAAGGEVFSDNKYRYESVPTTWDSLLQSLVHAFSTEHSVETLVAATFAALT